MLPRADPGSSDVEFSEIHRIAVLILSKWRRRLQSSGKGLASAGLIHFRLHHACLISISKRGEEDVDMDGKNLPSTLVTTQRT